MSILSGLLTALCFPNFNLGFLAWIALVPLLLEIEGKSNQRQAALSGFLFGLTFFSINLFWINTLNEFAPVFATLGWVCLAIGEAFFIAIACYLIKRLKLLIVNWDLLIIPIVWVSVEWLRTLGPFGISAGGLGYTQAGNLPLIQIASYTTVFGVSFLIVMVNSFLAYVINQRINSRLNFKREFILGFVILSMIFLIYLWGLFQIPPSPNPSSLNPLTISLIQGNIPQKMKLSYRYNADVFKIHEDLTRSVLGQKPDLIIWPETTIFSYLLHDPVFLPRIKKLARDSGAHLIVGTPHYDDKGNIFNSVVAFSPAGEVLDRYDKQRLVPFGEYLPLRQLFYPVLKVTNLFYEDFDFGPGTAQLLNLPGLKIGAEVCFESTFVGPSKDRARRGAQLLLTVTNDAWFGNSSALPEHLNCGVFRAVENRQYFIQAGNTGISAVIDPYGRILHRTRANQRGSLTFKIPHP
jgi:apolipoprotein N-acyltransferase